jgi:hypothetical protein
VRLIPPGSEAGFLGDTAIPSELYFVAREPSVIAGMAYPARIDWSLLHDAGVEHVVCLTHDAIPYDPSPLDSTAIALEDLYASRGPADPIGQRARIDRAAAVVVEHARRGEGVVVHCRGGRGRAGTVLGVALVHLGVDARAAVRWLDTLHRIRGKGGWPEHPWQADTVLQTRP